MTAKTRAHLDGVPREPEAPDLRPVTAEGGETLEGRVLVAGVGNLFFRDDGFGPEVVRRLLAAGELPEHARVVDYGIRGMHLAYDLLEGYDGLVLVDALPGAGRPGEVTVLEVGPDDLGTGELDAHGMDPATVLAGLHRLGGELPPTYVVGCRPRSLDEGIGLTTPVAAAVPEAMTQVRALLNTRMPARTRAPQTEPAGPGGA